MNGTVSHGRKPRALIIIENRPFPADVRVWPEAVALRDAGFEVTVISPMGATRWTAPFERIDSIDVYRFALPAASVGIRGYLTEYALAVLKSFWLAVGVYRRRGFDVLQVCNPPDLFFLHGLVFKLLGASFIFDQHDLTPELFLVRFGKSGLRGKLLGPLLYLTEWLTYRAADSAMVTNESFKALAMRRGGLPADRVFVVRNGPDEQRVRPVPPDPALKRGRPYLVSFVGEMNVQDGVDLAIRAVNWIVHTAGRSDVTFAFVGDGDQLAALQALARELDVAEYVDFPGYVESDRVMQYLCTSEVGLAPDPANGLNEKLTTIKIMEYMALGLPTVAFDLEENRRSAEGAGAYAKPNDHRELGRLVVELLDDPDRRRRMGEIGRRRVAEALSWRHSREELLRAYRAALARRPAGGGVRRAGTGPAGTIRRKLTETTGSRA